MPKYLDVKISCEMLLSFISLGATFITIQSSAVLANCFGVSREQVIQIKINSCENIAAEKNADVQQYAANLFPSIPQKMGRAPQKQT
jgi:hypothetical protein